MPRQRATSLEITLASECQRETIYRLRYAVYARELEQHAENPQGALRDDLDDFNSYIVAVSEDPVAGFISITPPGRRYSIDKYLPRKDLPFACDEGLYEIRLLTVIPERRGWKLAALLMYAAFRWVEAHGGKRIVALGRHEILDLYLRVGLEPTGRIVRSGMVSYHVLHARVDELPARFANWRRILARLEKDVQWSLPISFHQTTGCFHGGTFFEAVGDGFDALERHERIINADVLDAWFPPSPSVLAALQDHLSWLVRTSPPTNCGGLVRTIARMRGVEASCVLPGGGSSDLIFLALTRWLSPSSRVLILDPMYGEYAHVLERVVRCRVDRLLLSRAESYRLDPARLIERVEKTRYDLVILVNPNSPTGQHVPQPALEAALAAAPNTTCIWIDETYVEYADKDQSLERFAAGRENVVVCKSMSKVYALSGMRVGYLCTSPEKLDELRPSNPPWAVGLPAQVAAVKALDDTPYYTERWRETHALRADLSEELHRRTRLDIVSGVANFMLCHLPIDGPDAATVVARARDQGLFLRDASTMGTRLGPHTLRIAVKDGEANRRMVTILEALL